MGLTELAGCLPACLCWPLRATGVGCCTLWRACLASYRLPLPHAAVCHLPLPAICHCLPAACCLLLPAACFCPLPAAARCLLPAPVRCLPLPAACCRCLLLPVACLPGMSARVREWFLPCFRRLWGLRCLATPSLLPAHPWSRAELRALTTHDQKGPTALGAIPAAAPTSFQSARQS
jgi:hypothetical protein